MSRAVAFFVLAGAAWLAGCTGPPLDILPTELSPGVEGVSYSQRLVSDSDGVSWRVVEGALPPGLSLDAGSGFITGRPTVAGEYAFTVRARFSGIPGRAGVAAYVIRIVERLVITLELDAARVGEAYDITPEITGGAPPYEVSIVGLPAGFSYDPRTGRISGTPVFDSAGLPILMTVEDAGVPQQSATAQDTLVIRPEAVTITTTELPGATRGAIYEAAVVAELGRPPYEWTVTAGVLPAGLRLNRQTGAISGTVGAAAETRTFTIRVEDSDVPAAVDEVELTIEVVEGEG